MSITDHLFTSDLPGERRSWIFNPWLLLVFRLILAAVFIYTGLQKIGKPLAFADEIEMYKVLDYGPLLYCVAIVLPWIELLCGISLVSGIFIRGSALILLVMNAVFIAVIAFRTSGVMAEEGIGLFNVYFDCGCGFGATYAWKKLIEDLIFLALSCILLVAPAYRFVIIRRRRRIA
jgi:uncharacterized membrane protein YphA (DoxX/SURF4 family)